MMASTKMVMWIIVAAEVQASWCRRSVELKWCPLCLEIQDCLVEVFRAEFQKQELWTIVPVRTLIIQLEIL
jgi:hypothetical protein